MVLTIILNILLIASAVMAGLGFLLIGIAFNRNNVVVTDKRKKLIDAIQRAKDDGGTIIWPDATKAAFDEGRVESVGDIITNG